MRSHLIAQSGPSPRGGTTLTEVLMSIMLMGIGVVVLATLFPIAVLRSIQASQLTNATILRYNAEARIDMQLGLVLNPAVPPLAPSDYNGTGYIVDPLGWNEFSGTPFQAVFGNDGTAPLGTLARYPGGGAFTTLTSAANLVTLPDSWTTQTEGVPSAPLAAPFTSITLSNVDLNNIPFTGTPLPSRIVFFDDTGRAGQTRDITLIDPATNQIDWSAPLTGFTVEKARVVTRERRYTWLLTVRREANQPAPLVDPADVDVVVFFKRPADDLNDERIYTANFTAGNNQATVNFGTAPKPHYKKGGYVFDALNAYWYRIQDFTETATSVTLTLEEPARRTSNRAILMRGIVMVYPIGTK